MLSKRARRGPGYSARSPCRLFCDERVESTDEATVPVGLVAPPAYVGVGDKCLGIHPLGREHRGGAGVDVKRRAVFANVRVGARSLRRCPKAVAGGEPGLDERSITPVAIISDGDALRGQWPDAGFGQIQCSLVLGAHCGVEESTVTKAQLRRDVPEQGHERLERYSGVELTVANVWRS
jgi:hypothetical protein